MNIDLMVQNLVADVASIPQAGSDPGTEGADFDTLLRQQTQTNQPQRATEKPKDKQQPAQKSKPKENSTQEEITEDGYQVAAGLVTSQPVVLFDVVVPTEENAEISAVSLGDGVVEAPLIEVAETAQPVQEAVAEVLPQQEQNPVQEQTAPVELQNAAPQAEGTVEVAPEAVQPQREAAPVERQPEQKEAVHVASSQSAQVEEELPEDVDVDADVQEAWNGHSLFRQNTVVPTKVGENYEPVPLEEDGGDVQLSANLRDAVDQGLSRVELQLSPASLGNLTVEITRDHSGQISVVLRPETARAAALLNNADLSTMMLNKDGTYNLSMKMVVAVVQPEQPEQNQNQNQFLNPDGQNQQRHQQEQKEKKRKGASEEFLHQLRLGLVGIEG